MAGLQSLPAAAELIHRLVAEDLPGGQYRAPEGLPTSHFRTESKKCTQVLQ